MDDNVGSVLSQILADVLETRSIDRSKSFIDNGGNSLSLIYFIAATVRRYGIELTAQQVLGAASLDTLAATLVPCLRNAVPAPREVPPPPQGPVCGEVPLAANRFSYFDRRARDFEYWVLSPTLLRCHADFDPAALRRAVDCLVGHHDGLRLQLMYTERGWRQYIDAPGSLSHFIHAEFDGSGDDDAFVGFVERAIAPVYEAFTFPGALFKALLVTPKQGGACVLCLLAHHVAIDAFSIGVMLRDLNTAYLQAARGETPALPRKTMSYPDYVSESTSWWSTHASAIDSWRALPWHAVGPLPLTRPYAPEHNIEHHSTSSVASTDRLSRADLTGEGADAPPDLLPMLLAAIARAYGEWSSHEVLLVSVLFHGRESFLPGVDLSRTVGYICDFVPVLLPVGPDIDAVWREARDQVARARVSGKSYGVNRYLTDDARVRAEFAAHPEAQISLNVIPPQMRHAGHCDFGSLTTLFRRPPGTKATTQRAFLLSGGVYYADERFCIAWDYSRLLLEPATMDAFAESCLQHFLALRERAAAAA